MNTEENKGLRNWCHSGWYSFFILVIFLFIFSSCQRESEEITPVPPKEVILPNSRVADHIERIALKDGSADNIIDHASCISLVLPVTVIVNGEQIRIDSTDDLILVEKVLDETETDNDTVSIIFPVRIILADHSQLLINSEEEFENLAKTCNEGGGDDDIECIDFEYPLTLSVYDSLNQTFRTVMLLNDEELFEFFRNLKESDLASFKFPITVVLNDGSEIQVTDNDQLEDAIESAMQVCDEDDDNDHNDDDADVSPFNTILLGSNWQITYFFHETDQTSAFADFVFTFHSDSTVVASNGTSSFSGSWQTNGDDGSLELKLYFGEEGAFDDLDEAWKVIELSGSVIKLQHLGDDGQDTLVFEKK